MYIVRFIFTFLLTICLIVALNLSIKGLPAFGKLLNPYTGFYNLAENSDELHIPNRIESTQLLEDAEVYFDERRIPHIFTKNEKDLYYVQGYVVASLRLWQMEFQVLAAEGRISEILGNDKKYIDFDKKQRRIGLKFGAENKLKAMENDPQSQILIGRFTEGVNAYINELKGKDLPIEYQLMGYKPEPWSAYKTALLLMNMSNVLTSTEYDIENSNFAATYGKELFDSLFTMQEFPIIDPIVETPTKGWSASFTLDSLQQTPTLQNLNGQGIPTLSPMEDKPDVQIGSNNWALAGGKTASGYPLLANDPHLKLTFPSVWIEMHLHCPTINTYGVVFPGAPGIVIGFNDSIGWGVTNAGRDVKDWYEIEYKDHLKDFYKWEDGWRPTTKVIEEIKVKGAPSVFDTIVYTHLGPVALENYETASGKKNLALQWMAHKGSQEYKTFYELNKAHNFEDFLNALRHYECPAQNFVFACVNGDIAIRQQGKFPILENQEGVFYLDGSKKEAWNNFIPFTDIPMMHNPERNFVSSANQEVADESYPYFKNGVFEYYRNREINKNLRIMQQATVDDMKKLQYNVHNLLAEESLPLMLSYVNENKLNNEQLQIYNALKKWNYENTAESVEATYFQIFSESYYTYLWDEFVEKEVPGGWDPFKWKDGWKAPNEFYTYKLLRDSVPFQFIDNKGTAQIETQSDLINMAFNDMTEQVVNLTNTEWGAYKNTYIEHVAMLPAFSQHINVSGNYKIINATGKFHGPSWRMILDFSGGKIKGLGVYPGGQSGNPGSKYYDNMVEEWANGNYHELINNPDEQFYKSSGYIKVNFKTKSE